MRILFAAPEDAWGGILNLLRQELPHEEYLVSGRFGFDSLRGVDVLIPTMSIVTRDHLRDADRLRLIQQCGAGLEGVDIEAAKEYGIRVANVPTDISGNADSVAELGIYLMLALSRKARELAESLAARRIGTPRGRSLQGKSVGIIGLGGIGRALAKRLKPFNVRLLGIKRHDLLQAKEELGLDWIGTPDDLAILLREADYVVLCLPLTAESRHLLDRQALHLMKPGAYVINLSRGGLIDREALEEALATGTIAGAGLDVFWQEPVDPEDPLFQYHVIATPHVGGATDVAIQGILREVAENIRRLERGEEPWHHQ